MWYKVADRLKMTVTETKARLTVSEFRGWLEYLSQEVQAARDREELAWKRPTPLIWYIIRLIHEVCRVNCMWGGTPTPMDDLILEFSVAKDKEEKPEVVDEDVRSTKMALSKAYWGGLTQSGIGLKE